MAFLLACWPFDTRTNNYLNMYNEFVLLGAFGTSFVLSAHEFSEPVVNAVGWALIALVILSLAAIWCIMMPPLAKSVVSTVAGCFQAAKKPEEPKSKGKEVEEEKHEAAAPEEECKVFQRDRRFKTNVIKEQNAGEGKAEQSSGVEIADVALQEPPKAATKKRRNRRFKRRQIVVPPPEE